MTNRNPLIRPAMTAIAAVLACSTPSFAQSADAPAAETLAPTPTPVVAAPVGADPVVADPVAAEPAATEEAVATPATRATTTRTPAARSRPAPARAASAPAAAPAPSPADASAPAVADVAAVEPLPVEPEAAPLAAPVATDETSSTDNLIPALAAGALAILALAAAFLFLRRRKRHAGQAEDRAMRDSQLGAIDDAQPAMMAEPAPQPTMRAEPEPRPDPVKPAIVAAPAFATNTAPVVAAPSPATKAPVADSTPDDDGPVTELPEDFDLSRFGYNVQEAYKGPTEDNPSLSMKNRLTRARGMDQLERNLDAEVEAATGEPVLTEDELNPPAEASIDPATGEVPPSTSDRQPN